MLVLTKGQTAEYLYVTLNETRSLASGYYLFYFKHIITNEVVTKVYAFAEDESDYQDRINKFPINTNTVFSGQPEGEWTYKVYESASSTTDPDGLTIVEQGLLKLNPATEFEFEKYNEETTYKQYGG